MPPLVNVVVVPGFGGTQLSYKGGKGGKTAAWYNPSVIEGINPLTVALGADGKSPYPFLGKTLFADGPVAFGIYEPLLSFLASQGFAVKFFGYDWRLNLPDTAAAFTTFLQGLNLAPNFAVVCHSMGGLVAQLAYPLWQAAAPGPTWKQTFYLATPHGGSHWSYLCLQGIFSSGNWVALLGNLFSLSVRAIPGVSFIYDSLAMAVATTIGSWPSIYQMLPSNQGPWASLDARAAQSYLLSNYSQGPGGVQQAWLTQAQAVMTSLSSLIAKPRPNEFCFAGTGILTPNQMSAPPYSAALSDCQSAPSGDGTVDNERATLPASTDAYFSYTNHNDFCRTLPPLELLADWLETAPGAGGDFSNAVPTFGYTLATPTPVATLQFPTVADLFANKHGDP